MAATLRPKTKYLDPGIFVVTCGRKASVPEERRELHISIGDKDNLPVLTIHRAMMNMHLDDLPEDYANIAADVLEKIYEGTLLSARQSDALVANYLEVAMQYVNVSLLDPIVEERSTRKHGPNNGLAKFVSRINEYSGSSTSVVDRELIRDLDHILFETGIPKGRTVRKLPTLSDGTKEGTSIAILCKAVSKLDKPRRAEALKHVEQIARHLWGYEYPTIDETEIGLLSKDYEAYQVIIDKLLAKSLRKANPNGNMRLWVHLIHRGIPAVLETLKIPDPKSKAYKINATILNEASRRMGWVNCKL